MNNSSNAPVIFINGLIGTLNDPKFHRPLGDRPVIAPDLNGYGARSDIRSYCRKRAESRSPKSMTASPISMTSIPPSLSNETGRRTAPSK